MSAVQHHRWLARGVPRLVHDDRVASADVQGSGPTVIKFRVQLCH